MKHQHSVRLQNLPIKRRENSIPPRCRHTKSAPSTFGSTLLLRLLVLLVGGCLLAGLQTASAQLNFTLQTPNPTVAPGSNFSFFATLTNTDPNNSIDLTGDNTTYSDPNANDFTDNFLNAPPSLTPAGTVGSSWTGDLFDVTVPSNAVSGTMYTGTYELDFMDGGVAGSVSQPFSVTVGGHATTPEAGSMWILLLLGGIGMLWRLRLRGGLGSVWRVGLLCGVMVYGSGFVGAQAQDVEPVVLVHTFSALHAFLINSDGVQPSANVIQGRDGALYGTAERGGANGLGVVFRVNPDGSNFQVIHNFSAVVFPSINSDGAEPGSVTQGRDGALYGITGIGGANGFGVVYKVNPDGSNFQVLHDFNNSSGGVGFNNIIQGSDGDLYGTRHGDASNSGMVFKVNTDGSNFQVLHAFSAENNRGENSDGALANEIIQGRDGAFYGTTVGGGANATGVVFKVNPDGSNYQVIHTFSAVDSNFANSDGALPFAGVSQGMDGALYGTTELGGANGNGVVFKLNINGSNFQVLHNFSALDNHRDNSDGALPFAGVSQGMDGALYGTTNGGGANGQGVLFRVNPDGSNFQVLHTFSAKDNNGDNSDGAGFNNIIQGSDGDLYGTAAGGGANGNGVVFRIGPQALFLNPNNAPAGSNNLTLTLLGNGFAQNDTLLWNGTTSLTPTSVSSDGTQIQATIPPNLLTTPGVATVQVQDPNIHNTTPPLVLLIGTVQIHLQVSSIARDSNNNVVVTFTITNTGGATATNLTVSSSVLTDSTRQKFNTSSSLPMSLGTLSAGGSVSATLVFPSTAVSGLGLLQVHGSYGGGSFGGSFRVTVP
ncbi:MAG TPA: choice-of-anchor tandem repeat GloVer-containing protein [Chthonomonas sp.]|uniref:choice-of-anchor tandem repeat GloVer-containing protein n=1 Tax=Chthonomonas sp. TaxID=2282153 RepID=UPI002B4ACAEF|nr:choice-of-anchor tandem repeat GloVer-containing protein [Chthonomonas sp.]HLI47338.1 choice-of-anchor tandem repeat GloVer-containing protein [Chthonomonas sp.]